jgi:hypothetical protein
MGDHSHRRQASLQPHITLIPDHLTQEGAYLVSRNPLYLGGPLMWTGWSAFYGNLQIAAVGSGWFLLVLGLVLPFEERSSTANSVMLMTRIVLGSLGGSPGAVPIDCWGTRALGAVCRGLRTTSRHSQRNLAVECEQKRHFRRRPELRRCTPRSSSATPALAAPAARCPQGSKGRQPKSRSSRSIA